MSSQPQHDTYEDPSWQVYGVFDPDGDKPDFSYTVGLHDRGLPELHLWAQPDRGHDPGADWKLSQRDRGHLLNEFAELALRGRLGVGTQVDRRYDDGSVLLRFHVGEPADRDVIEAYAVAPAAVVLPVHWSLERAPEGVLSPMAPEHERAAAAAYEEIVAGLARDRRPAPRGWSLPRTPTYEPDQRFGPRTPVVLARAAQLWQAEDETVADLIRTGSLVETSGTSLTRPAAVAAALAREIGRRQCLQDLHDDVHRLVDWLSHRPASRARWQRIARAVDPVGWMAASAREREEFARGCVGVLHDLAIGCLSVEVIADVAGPDLLLSARGPWLSGLDQGTVVPGPAWAAAPEVLRVVTDLLAPLDAERLGIVARLHGIAMTTAILEAPGYGDLCRRLYGWAIVSAAGCPWEPTLSSLPAWRAVHGGLASRELLGEWATCLSSALTHRWQLTGEDVRTLTALYREDLPLLEQRLNEPV